MAGKRRRIALARKKVTLNRGLGVTASRKIALAKKPGSLLAAAGCDRASGQGEEGSQPVRRIAMAVRQVDRGMVQRSGHVGLCLEHCTGEFRGGVWIHSPGCSGTVMLYTMDGKDPTDWACPYRCEPTEMPSGWTHHWQCGFWNQTQQTPIDGRGT